MKKKNITIFLLVLLCFGLISCDDEFGVLGLRNGELYILLPNNSYIEEPFSEYKGDLSYLCSCRGYENTTFNSLIKNEKEKFKIYTFKTNDYYGELSTRKDFLEEVCLSVKGNVNGKTFSEDLIIQIKIPYLNQGNNCCEFQIETKNVGKIIVVYTYYFSQYI